MKKVHEYELLSEPTLSELNASVKTLIALGWQPHGSPFCANNYYQAMTLSYDAEEKS
jgi:hypothetical protein